MTLLCVSHGPRAFLRLTQSSSTPSEMVSKGPRWAQMAERALFFLFQCGGSAVCAVCKGSKVGRGEREEPDNTARRLAADHMGSRLGAPSITPARSNPHGKRKGPGRGGGREEVGGTGPKWSL